MRIIAVMVVFSRAILGSSAVWVLFSSMAIPYYPLLFVAADLDATVTLSPVKRLFLGNHDEVHAPSAIVWLVVVVAE